MKMHEVLKALEEGKTIKRNVCGDCYRYYNLIKIHDSQAFVSWYTNEEYKVSDRFIFDLGDVYEVA